MATELRSVLGKTDGSAPAIHKSASTMMKHYDRSADVAVTEWRNALHTSEPHQLLPLLYVANEVLQNSKRNRGNKFLEAFSPTLGQSLITICQRCDAETVEKVRRTTKIWGDRRVFSVRYVNELLKGLEQYRFKDDDEPTSFSPSPESPKQEAEPTPVLKPDSDASTPVVTNKAVESEDEDSDDDSLGFGGVGDSSSQKEESLGHLDIDFSISNASFDKSTAPKKRKRNCSVVKRRKTILSTTSLMDLWNQVQSLQEGLENSQRTLNDVSQSLDSQIDVDQLVGDELLEQYKMVLGQQTKVNKERKSLHTIANERRALEQQSVRYIPWLQGALKQDEEDVAFCLDLAKKIKELKYVHETAKAARDEMLQEEAIRQAKEAEEARKKKDEEERKQLLESAINTEQEAKPGQVWNKALQQYQYLNTDESWRD